jgi:nicotinamidase-related amidase
MPSYTLVVVDMQSTFAAANRPNVVIAVAREMFRAMKDKAPIILLEYQHCDPTHRGFLDILKGHKEKIRLKKPNDDGSAEVVKTLKDKDWPSVKIRVCGVNTDCCVLATVKGLLKKLPKSKVELVKSACGAAASTRFDWRNYHRHKNLSLV